MRFLLVVLLSIPCAGFAQVDLGDPGTVARLNRPSSSSPAPTYIVEQDAETTDNPPAGWTNTSTGHEWGDADAPAPLEGAGSLRTSSGNSVYTSFTGVDEFWACCMFQLSAISSIPYVMIFRNSGTQVAAVRVLNTGAARVYSGTVSADTASSGGIFPLTINTTYYTWIHWTKGTGSDGTAEVYFSTTSTKPGSPDASVTTGNATLSCTILRIDPNATATLYSDHIRVDDENIGSNPP